MYSVDAAIARHFLENESPSDIDRFDECPPWPTLGRGGGSHRLFLGRIAATSGLRAGTDSARSLAFSRPPIGGKPPAGHEYGRWLDAGL